MAHIAKRASARAFITHDHEGGSAFAKALADIRAGGLLTDGNQLVGPQNVFDFVKTGATRGSFYPDPVGLFQDFGCLHFDRNARQLSAGLLLDHWVVGGAGRAGVGHGSFQGDRALCRRAARICAASSQAMVEPIVERSTVRKPA